MGHHSGTPEFNEEDLKQAFKFPDATSIKGEFPRLKDLGATGQFQEGKITEHDEGEIRIGITTHEGKIVIDFGKKVSWVGLNKSQAKLIAESLLKRAEEI